MPFYPPHPTPYCLLFLILRILASSSSFYLVTVTLSSFSSNGFLTLIFIILGIILISLIPPSPRPPSPSYASSILFPSASSFSPSFLLCLPSVLSFQYLAVCFPLLLLLHLSFSSFAIPEMVFLDINSTNWLESFAPCYSPSLLLADFQENHSLLLPIFTK